MAIKPINMDFEIIHKRDLEKMGNQSIILYDLETELWIPTNNILVLEAYKEYKDSPQNIINICNEWIRLANSNGVYNNNVRNCLLNGLTLNHIQYSLQYHSLLRCIAQSEGYFTILVPGETISIPVETE